MFCEVKKINDGILVVRTTYGSGSKNIMKIKTIQLKGGGHLKSFIARCVLTSMMHIQEKNI
jgi:hypothetical protein